MFIPFLSLLFFIYEQAQPIVVIISSGLVIGKTPRMLFFYLNELDTGTLCGEQAKNRPFKKIISILTFHRVKEASENVIRSNKR